MNHDDFFANFAKDALSLPFPDVGTRRMTDPLQEHVGVYGAFYVASWLKRNGKMTKTHVIDPEGPGDGAVSEHLTTYCGRLAPLLSAVRGSPGWDLDSCRVCQEQLGLALARRARHKIWAAWHISGQRPTTFTSIMP